MNSAELADRTGEAKRIIQAELGDIHAFGIVPGTGWNEGVKAAFKPALKIPYQRLGVPGSELEVPGHSKSLVLGDIDGRDTLVLGRVHPNENITHPDLRQAMALVIGAVDECLDGLVLTNGVGTLHGRVGVENGLIHSLVQTAVLDVMGWAHRGRRQERIDVGDVALVDDVKTATVGGLTPLGAGDFIDFYHNGIHRDGNEYFDLTRRVIADVQGRCPRAQSRFISGPQFESPADKLEFRGRGDDVIGMSGIQEILACTKLGIPFEQIVLATNGPFGLHDHFGNQRTGGKNAEKAARILRGLSQSWPRHRNLRKAA
jgi:purine nucleoside phosphorylase